MAGNQSPDPLIDFNHSTGIEGNGWESVTRPLDRLLSGDYKRRRELGISHQTP